SMTRMVNDLFDVARLERHQVELRKHVLDLNALLSQVVELMRDRPEAKECTLTLDLPPTPTHVEGDATRLEQIVSNLLTNALKFTLPGGAIAVTLAVEDGAPGDGHGDDRTPYAVVRVCD